MSVFPVRLVDETETEVGQTSGRFYDESEIFAVIKSGGLCRVATMTDAGEVSQWPAGPVRATGRLRSLDQFRGYTVAAMFFVNFAGGFAAMPEVIRHHHTYCSYADTIMPQFLFAVGFALRLVVLRNREAFGAAAALGRAWRRIGLLFLVGFVFYHLDFEWWAGGREGVPFWKPVTTATLWRETFQTLGHIAVTSLWVLPVIAGSARGRLVFGLVSVGVHAVVSAVFWYDLLHEKRVIDGGPLGFLTWTVPALAGSFAYDFRHGRGAVGSLRPLLGWGVGLMVAGYGLSCFGVGGPVAAPPFFPPDGAIDQWTMSQRAGSASYLVFAAGLAMAVYAGFVWWCDVRGKAWGVFAILGANALLGYLLHEVVMRPFEALAEASDPWWWAVLVTAAFMAVTTLLVWWCNRRGWYLRL
jgi:predicted acyltransferase